MHDRTAAEQPLQLVLPVRTEPAVLQQAVVSVLCGQAELCLSNVEPLLVVANSIGVNKAY